MGDPPPILPLAQAAAAETDPSAVAAGRARGGLARLVSLGWVPLTAALLSLALSVVAIYTSTQQPSVTLLMPAQVRIAQGRSSGAAYLYLQPAFVNTAQNNRVEVIRGMTLHVVAADSTVAPADFRWTQQLRLVTDATTGQLTYQYVGDALPLVVSPSNAASPLSLFEAPGGWFFSGGNYNFTLTADRVVAGSPLTATFSVNLTADNITFLDQPGPDLFLEFAIK
ncbi:MAG: hypothetical protein ABI744_08370 [Chloroflexota bacterium]